jgi:hypothetical protein
MSLQEGVELNISTASWISGYVLEITFIDGFSRKVDFESFLKASDQSGIRKYLDLDAFKGFVISFGNLMWNDYSLCFSIEDLYSGFLGAHGDVQAKVAENETEYRTGSGTDK